MTQAIGALLVVIGALMFHIASSNLPHSSISDIWDDMKKMIAGEVTG